MGNLHQVQAFWNGVNDFLESTAGKVAMKALKVPVGTETKLSLLAKAALPVYRHLIKETLSPGAMVELAVETHRDLFAPVLKTISDKAALENLLQGTRQMTLDDWRAFMDKHLDVAMKEGDAKTSIATFKVAGSEYALDEILTLFTVEGIWDKLDLSDKDRKFFEDYFETNMAAFKPMIFTHVLRDTFNAVASDFAQAHQAFYESKRHKLQKDAIVRAHAAGIREVIARFAYESLQTVSLAEIADRGRDLAKGLSEETIREASQYTSSLPEKILVKLSEKKMAELKADWDIAASFAVPPAQNFAALVQSLPVSPLRLLGDLQAVAQRTTVALKMS